MCLPADGGRRHTFSINRRQAHGSHPHGETCPSCDVKPGLAQGPIALTDFFHTANEIGQLLALVGRGTSLRKASQLVRYDAQRFFTDTHGHRWASREFALAARYLDQFADLIDTELAPKSWPKILVLDSKPLLLYPYDADEFGEQWDPNDRAGAILVAAGGDDPRRQMKAWRIGLAGDETRQSWLDFLSQLPGDVEWVVADGAKAIEPAVRERWPNARFFSCEFHLGRALRSWAESDGWHAEHPAIKTLLAQALWSVADWDALRAFAEHNQAESILRWMDGNELRLRRQLAHRQRPFHRHPRSNSEAEYVINSIDRKLTRRRRFRLRNARRLQMILNLMRADFAGQGGAVEYAAMVKRHLERLDWRFDPDWNVNQDDSKQLRSLSRVLLDSRKHRQQASAIYMADAKMRSVLLRIQEDNAIRASLGYPPLEFEIKPGQRTVSVTVAGMMLSDFPEITRDWDHAKNTLDPLALRAGSDAVAHWKCHRCRHEWTAEIGQRTKRRTRCKACATNWATDATSVAALRPDLALEWDRAANGTRVPEKIKATSGRAVVWRCRDFPTDHPPYRMSPKTRGKRPIGCRICRKMRQSRPTDAPAAKWTDDVPF